MAKRNYIDPSLPPAEAASACVIEDEAGERPSKAPMDESSKSSEGAAAGGEPRIAFREPPSLTVRILTAALVARGLNQVEAEQRAWQMCSESGS